MLSVNVATVSCFCFYTTVKNTDDLFNLLVWYDENLTV